MTSRKDYAVIANMVKHSLDDLPIQEYIAARTALENFAHELADYFEANHPQFDKARFLTACGL
jgi:hypothetical protein